MVDAMDEEVLELERAGWAALADDPDAATAFYGTVLDDDITMLLPGGLLLRDRTAVLESMAGPSWSAYELADEVVVAVDEGVRLVTYAASARRGDQEHRALYSSLYVRRPEGWRLVLHQQTS